MLDELRGSDWMSRGDRRHQRSIETAVHKLEQKLGRAPTEGEIAKEMGLSPSTVSTYRTRILRKLGLTSNAALVHYAVRHQLVG
jgi:RNA polymerase sigma factor for flagellar operon FliA